MNRLRAFKHTDIQALPTEVPFQAHFGNLHLSGTTCIHLWPSWPGSVQSRVEPTAQLFEEAVSELPPPPTDGPSSAGPSRCVGVCPAASPRTLETQLPPLFSTLWASGKGLSWSSPGQIPLGLWLTRPFWQPLSFRSAHKHLGSGPKTSLTSWFSSLTVGTNLFLFCLFAPVHSSILSWGYGCAILIQPHLPGFPVHTCVHTWTLSRENLPNSSQLCTHGSMLEREGGFWSLVWKCILAALLPAK